MTIDNDPLGLFTKDVHRSVRVQQSINMKVAQAPKVDANGNPAGEPTQYVYDTTGKLQAVIPPGWELDTTGNVVKKA
jgi:hypothetical protein